MDTKIKITEIQIKIIIITGAAITGRITTTPTGRATRPGMAP
jgi:hypothetical protein